MVDEGWFDNVLMIDFADYLQNQLVDSEIHSQYDKNFYISRKVIYIVESLRFLFVSFCTYQNQQQMTHDLNSQDFSEFLLALHEGLNNNNIVKNLYTIPQVDTLIATCVKNNAFQELTNEFYFHNVNNIWIGSYLNPITLEIQHHPLIDVAVGADPDDSKIIATKAYVNDALANFNPTNLQNYYTTQQIDAMLTNYYTSLQVDTIFNNYYTSQYIDANYYTTLATRNMLDTLHNTIISEVNEMFNNNQQPQVWNNQINMSNPLNSITAGLLTMGNIGLSAIVGGSGSSSNNDKGVTQGYVDEEINTNYVAACSYTDTKKQQMEQSFTTQSFTLRNNTVTGIAIDSTPGSTNSLLVTSDFLLYTLNQMMSGYLPALNIYGTCYPIGSYFFYDTKITLVNNKPTFTTNTILDYFEWKLIQESANSIAPGARAVFGILTDDSGASEGFLGLRKLAINNIPAHSHNGLISSTHHSFVSQQGPWCLPTSNDGTSDGTTYQTNDSVKTAQNIGHIAGGDWYTDSPQQEFTPRGYYTFCYKRIA